MIGEIWDSSRQPRHAGLVHRKEGQINGREQRQEVRDEPRAAQLRRSGDQAAESHDADERPKHRAQGQHVVKVGDHVIRIVQRDVQGRVRQHESGQTADREEGDERHDQEQPEVAVRSR